MPYRSNTISKSVYEAHLNGLNSLKLNNCIIKVEQILCRYYVIGQFAKYCPTRVIGEVAVAIKCMINI